MLITQGAAEAAVRYCNAMAAYDLREATLTLYPLATLENMIKNISDGDEEHASKVIAQGREGIIATILEFEIGGAVEEATKILEALNVDVKQLELIRKFGAVYPLVCTKWFNSFIVTPDDANPSEELASISSVDDYTIEQEDSEDEEGKYYIEWHLNKLNVTDLIKVVQHYKMTFKSLDNSEYRDAENCQLGDLTFSNDAGVTLTIYMMEDLGHKFSEWAPQLKALIEKQTTPVTTEN